MMRTADIECSQGVLRGEDCVSYIVFRGIPYAKAPVGPLRFCPPEPTDAWDGVKEALTFGSICPQPDLHNGFYGREFYNDPEYPVPAMSEDCLYLNIWMPKRPGKYPVAFWIHGGGFDHGFSSEKEFDGKKFTERNIVLVTVNYRVGVFGFFADEKLRKESKERTTGNYGILDQIAALNWVYNNISAFFGDPDKITVFGQSAGALSAEVLCGTDLTYGKIHNAIFQSAVSYESGAREHTLEQAEETCDVLKLLLGVRTAEEMRNLPADTLVNILPELYKRTDGLAFAPVIDGYVLKDTMDNEVRRGTIQDIPYMLGMTDNDIFVKPGCRGRDSGFYQGIQKWAVLRSAYSYEPVYLYYFQRHLPGDAAGAFHSSELWYMFGTMDRCWRPWERKDMILSDRMMDAWASFMRNSDPGKDWLPYQKKTQFIRTFL